MAKIKVTDYIIKKIIENNVNTIFGYPGGVVCHLIDSATKYSDKIDIKLNYHEQASAFSACGYAQASGKLGVAFATSGPGATNLITGIANAWFDSLPVLFLTGQVDTYALKSNIKSEIRQYGFQETDIVSIVKPITKYCIQILKAEDIKEELDKAIKIALSNRKGPVLIDLPADIQRAFIEVGDFNELPKEEYKEKSNYYKIIQKELKKSKRPIFLVGAGLNQCNLREDFRKLANDYQIPVVTSMSAIDILPYDDVLNCGFIGVNGHRYANLILAKSDLVICIGTRLDLKQIGIKRQFFKNQKIIRVDIDKNELNYFINHNEIRIETGLKTFLKDFNNISEKCCHKEWIKTTNKIKEKLKYANDNEEAHKFLRKISSLIQEDVTYSLDVGQNQVWAIQALELKNNQKVIMSAGLGTMGYALPAAIGAYYATQKPSIAIVGDGGIQMNIQELQFISHHKLPITIILCNNRCLGMIRQFQEKNFNSNYKITTLTTGYSVPDFKKIAKAYNIKCVSINKLEELKHINISKPNFIEVNLDTVTYLEPAFGKDNLFDQIPNINRELYNEIMEL